MKLNAKQPPKKMAHTGTPCIWNFNPSVEVSMSQKYFFSITALIPLTYPKLTVSNVDRLIFLWSQFQRSAMFHCQWMMWNAHTFLCFLRKIQHDKVKSLWPRDTIWWYISRSTLDQVMACCLTAPSHYQNQSWHPLVRFSGIHLRAIS